MSNFLTALGVAGFIVGMGYIKERQTHYHLPIYQLYGGVIGGFFGFVIGSMILVGGALTLPASVMTKLLND